MTLLLDWSPVRELDPDIGKQIIVVVSTIRDCEGVAAHDQNGTDVNRDGHVAIVVMRAVRIRLPAGIG